MPHETTTCAETLLDFASPECSDVLTTMYQVVACFSVLTARPEHTDAPLAVALPTMYTLTPSVCRSFSLALCVCVCVAGWVGVIQSTSLNDESRDTIRCSVVLGPLSEVVCSGRSNWTACAAWSPGDMKPRF
ncbi:unnamed protein product [Protopolystoma xenopodis]|uniref:Uncharacterized protein n=1 Tax=Protopolystoma xenopodis TaxID=117903 RepID=A0A3S5CFX2_9PLAT|nr:unnamed protein product [Protopolystoma xenopodis]